jgi:Uma2 family endonuclease
MTMQERQAAAAASQRRASAAGPPGWTPATPPPAPVSWGDFLAWLDEDVRAEWVDGAIIEMPPADLMEHQDRSGLLYMLLQFHVQPRRLGRVFYSPALMRLPNRRTGRDPDLLFVAAEHEHRIRGAYLDGAADLVVEIVSPESVERDYHEKLAEYEAAGIPEYWIVDPQEEAALFYQLGADSRYQLATVPEDGIYTSRVVPGFRLRVSWLWQQPLPSIQEALADLPGARPLP